MNIISSIFTAARYSPRQLIFSTFLFFITLIFISTNSYAAVGPKGNPHYNKIGFFDMHVCNWPNQPLFFLSLFSTTKYNAIKKIEVFDNHHRLLGQLNLNKYRVDMLKNPTREKHVFINHLAIPKTSGNGWYSSRVYLKDGSVYSAKDYVIIYKMERATGLRPAENETLKTLPTTFRWLPIPGAKYYRIFIKDIWSDKTIYKSEFLTKPELTLPKNILKHDGDYCWRVHARDTNESVLLGDFNHGSLTKCFEFDIKN